MTSFAARLLRWWDQHGRKDLPWQLNKTPYRVWLSEIMLQQTQVATAIPYFERFTTHLPDVRALARADLDTVLHLWTGLGYYARGRNLHRAAQLIVTEHGGELPHDIAALTALPGIGRSTAHAIATIAMGQRAPILDGNVRRVLSRWRAIEGWPGVPAVERSLWQLAGELLPATRADDYTQAIMDLGATLCTRSRPDCGRCPVASDCFARQQSRTTTLPARKPKPALPVRTTRMLIIVAPDNTIFLEHRPATGLWGGLWSFPEQPLADAATDCLATIGVPVDAVAAIVDLPVRTHTFTHFRLQIQPTLLQLSRVTDMLMEPHRHVWYKPGRQRIGLSGPVLPLLRALHLNE